MEANPHALWQGLATAALLGTERQPAPPAPPGGALGPLLAPDAAGDPAQDLLRAAAVLSVYRRAGYRPAEAQAPLPDAVPPGDLPRCGTRAGGHLAQMLAGEHAAALPEWLTALAATRRRVPEALIPLLLEAGSTKRSLREAILPTLGKWGQWLAAQNPDWQWSMGGESEESWETAGRDARRLLVRRLRERDPNHARELVRSTWSEEPPEERAAFLEAFVVGLSGADEEFLEEALDDRRKEVRRTASDLLARLPGSALCRRMAERVRPLLAFTPGQKPRIFPPAAARKPRLDVTLPEACDKAMVRDGIEAKPPQGTGEKAWWLRQMLAVVPPAAWSVGWHVSPVELAEVAAGTEWKDALLDGWAQAAGRHHDAAWAEVLLPLRASRSGEEIVGLLVDALPPGRRDAVLVELIARDRGGARDTGPAMQALPHCRYPWSRELTRAVLRFLRGRPLYGQNQIDWYTHGALMEAAPYMAPAAAEEAASLFGDVQGVDDFLSFLRFRQEMLEALREA